MTGVLVKMVFTPPPCACVVLVVMFLGWVGQIMVVEPSRWCICFVVVRA